MRTLIAVVLVAAGPAALADPAAEMDQLKGLMGVWRCEGKITLAGKDAPLKYTYVVSPELDGFWYVGRTESAKSAELPAFKARDIFGYDAAAKTFTMYTIDNLGASTTARSKGWTGDRMVWTGKTHVGAAEMDLQNSLTRKGERELAISGTQTGAQPATWTSSCKR